MKGFGYVMDTELLSRAMFKRKYGLVHLALMPHETFIIKFNGFVPWMMVHLKETVNIQMDCLGLPEASLNPLLTVNIFDCNNILY